MLLRQFSPFLALALAPPAAQAGSDEGGQIQSCADVSKPSTFSLKGVTYIRYEVAPYAMDAMPNSTQLVFDVVNNANGVSIGCTAQNVEYEGRWGDTSNYWYDCQDQSLKVHGEEYPIKTNTRIIWDDWKLSVNQTVDCAGTVVRHISTATLAPDCQETESATQYIENCQIPDLEVSATSQ